MEEELTEDGILMFMWHLCTAAHTIRGPVGSTKAFKETTSCLKHRKHFHKLRDGVGRAFHAA